MQHLQVRARGLVTGDNFDNVLVMRTLKWLPHTDSQEYSYEGRSARIKADRGNAAPRFASLCVDALQASRALFPHTFNYDAVPDELKAKGGQLKTEIELSLYQVSNNQAHALSLQSLLAFATKYLLLYFFVNYSLSFIPSYFIRRRTRTFCCQQSRWQC
jgi:hypothetical protein